MSIAIKRRKSPDNSLLPELGNPVLSRIATSRGIVDSTQLDCSLNGLLSFEGFKDMSVAARLIADAIQRGDLIVIAGDYDCDGCTASSIMYRGLGMCGSDNHEFKIPDRIRHGYGLSDTLVEEIHENFASVQGNRGKLLITVDSGISNIDGVAKAKSLGWSVIVTDHHLCGENLPDADAIINPQQPECDFESKNVAGCGVAWYVIVATARELESRGAFEGQKVPDVGSLLDIVALGTIADLVALDKNNRILVSAGLTRMRAGHACAGINSLMEVSNVKSSKVTEVNLGFALGPRINAAGRIKDASLGVHALITDDQHKAQSLACRLDQINAERKSIQNGMEEEASVMIADSIAAEGQVPPGVVLYNPEWPEGIIGIMAGQVKERLYRPVIVFSDAHGDEIKGSGRSIDALHLRDLLHKIDVLHPGMISKFGGHHMACGLSIKKSMFEEFRARFEQYVSEELSAEDYEKTLLSDGELTASDFSVEFARDLRKLGPYGQKFEEPLFDGVFTITGVRVLKEKHVRLQLRPEGATQDVVAIKFNVPDALSEWKDSVKGAKVRAAYKLQENEYTPYGASQPLVSVQMILEYLERI